MTVPSLVAFLKKKGPYNWKIWTKNGDFRVLFGSIRLQLQEKSPSFCATVVNKSSQQLCKVKSGKTKKVLSGNTKKGVGADLWYHVKSRHKIRLKSSVLVCRINHPQHLCCWPWTHYYFSHSWNKDWLQNIENCQCERSGFNFYSTPKFIFRWWCFRGISRISGRIFWYARLACCRRTRYLLLPWSIQYPAFSRWWHLFHVFCDKYELFFLHMYFTRVLLCGPALLWRSVRCIQGFCVYF